MDYKQKLPSGVQKRLDDYMERIKKIKWFQPKKNLSKKDIEQKVDLVFETFGVKAKLEYKRLETMSDWDAAWDAAWGAARDAAWDAARDAAWDAARDAARDAAWGAAWGAAWDAARDAARDAAWGAAWGANDLLVQDLPEYKKKYPKGNFINLIPLWEMGLCPVGIVNGKFIIYIPPYKKEFSQIK